MKIWILGLAIAAGCSVYGDPTLGGLGIWSLATEANGAIAFSGDT
jgi:hypothetical protein